MVDRTDYYSNTSDTDRSYNVSARVTLKADGTNIVKEGEVRPKNGDVLIATFEKVSSNDGMYSPTGGGNETFRIVFPSNPATVAVKAAVNDICSFLDEVSALAAE